MATAFEQAPSVVDADGEDMGLSADAWAELTSPSGVRRITGASSRPAKDASLSEGRLADVAVLERDVFAGRSGVARHERANAASLSAVEQELRIARTEAEELRQELLRTRSELRSVKRQLARYERDGGRPSERTSSLPPASARAPEHAAQDERLGVAATDLAVAPQPEPVRLLGVIARGRPGEFASEFAADVWLTGGLDPAAVPHGVFLATYRELRAGELFELTLEFDTGAAVTLPACVRWVRGASELGEAAGVGFEFTLVSPEHAALLLGAQHGSGSLYVEL